MAKQKTVHVVPEARFPLTTDEKRRIYKKEWSDKNKERRRVNSIRWRKENQDKVKESRVEFMKSSSEFLIAIREQNPCSDCGEYFPYYVMEFDHKEDNSCNKSVISCRGWPSLLGEISKCDIVCSNCHKIRTHKRRQNGWKYGKE